MENNFENKTGKRSEYFTYFHYRAQGGKIFHIHFLVGDEKDGKVWKAECEKWIILKVTVDK